jgi:hypothetical protein
MVADHSLGFRSLETVAACRAPLWSGPEVMSVHSSSSYAERMLTARHDPFGGRGRDAGKAGTDASWSLRVQRLGGGLASRLLQTPHGARGNRLRMGLGPEGCGRGLKSWSGIVDAKRSR